MKGMARAVIFMLAAAMALITGCTVVEKNECCNDDTGYCEYWEDYGGWTTLYVGEECPGGGCDFSDYDYALDTLEFTWWDRDMVDLQFNFTLTNYDNRTTFVWVDMCDWLDCENVVEIELLPGEVYWDRVPTEVLDTALYEFYDCLDYYGSGCLMYYELEVWVGEEDNCSPVTLDYFYEGLYVY